jgi:hypothetical protein
LASIVAIAAAPGSLWVADRGTQKVYRLAIESGAFDESIDVEAAPTRLTPLGNGTSWLIRGRTQTGDPILVLDASSPQRVLFVPGGDQQ